jgi:hypothetical protein
MEKKKQSNGQVYNAEVEHRLERVFLTYLFLIEKSKD